MDTKFINVSCIHQACFDNLCETDFNFFVKYAIFFTEFFYCTAFYSEKKFREMQKVLFSFSAKYKFFYHQWIEKTSIINISQITHENNG